MGLLYGAYETQAFAHAGDRPTDENTTKKATSRKRSGF